jgi:hypothetical protein
MFSFNIFLFGRIALFFCIIIYFFLDKKIIRKVIITVLVVAVNSLPFFIQSDFLTTSFNFIQMIIIILFLMYFKKVRG